jgi:hypothetical protein
MHKRTGAPFVLNDLGITGTIDSSTGTFGWALPVGKDTVLAIFPRRNRDVAIHSDDKWWAIIEHLYNDVLDVKKFNESTASRATSYVIGASEKIVESLAPIVGTYASDSHSMMEAWPFSPRTRLTYCREWYRLVSATHGNPAPEALGDLRVINPDALTTGWCPAMGVVLNVREFPTALKRNGPVIKLSLESPPLLNS